MIKITMNNGMEIAASTAAEAAEFVASLAANAGAEPAVKPLAKPARIPKRIAFFTNEEIWSNEDLAAGKIPVGIVYSYLRDEWDVMYAKVNFKAGYMGTFSNGTLRPELVTKLWNGATANDEIEAAKERIFIAIVNS